MATEAKANKPKKEKKKGRFAHYVREVVSEVKKLAWPTKKELASYTLAVLAFILLMAVIIYACDFVFGQGMTLLAGL
ncbi:MAG: preprotein translocase subunit SecE [Clostridia bacterium]|nr:preprotein translocase subunit SecE [Clostridia bacterium]